MTDKMNEVKATAQAELNQVQSDLIALRNQRSDLAAKIKAKVEEEAELQSLIRRLTPRTRTAPQLTGVVTPPDDQADEAIGA